MTQPTSSLSSKRRSTIGSLMIFLVVAVLLTVGLDTLIVERKTSSTQSCTFLLLGTHGFATPRPNPSRPPRPPRIRHPRGKNSGNPSPFLSPLSVPKNTTWSDCAIHNICKNDTTTTNTTLNTNQSSNNDNNVLYQSHHRQSLLRHQQALQDPSLLTNLSFSERNNNNDSFHPLLLRALTEGMGIHSMTQIQARTYKPALEGKSIMASSRTGSGKTIAFLLPSIERLLKHDLDIYRPGRSIGVIILSPTRELAIQIANQAQELLQYLPKANQLPVACLYGGVKMQRDIRLLTGGTSPARLPAIVVSTPGRLIDHLEGNTRLGPGHNNKFATILDGTKIVILDEMDRLWETHQKETKQILTVLARSNKRQTLLFSATFSRPLRRLLKESILKGQQVYEVDCIQDGDDGHDENANANGAVGSGTINKRIQQSYVLIDNMAQYTEILLTILRRELLQDNHFKILVFFPTSRMVRFFHQLFTMGKINLGRRQQQRGKHDTGSRNNKRETLLWEIHSHMSQSSRTRASESFRNAKRGILFSTDVSARGMDYPDVTLVVQMGAPTKESQYIHRLGRSGRAGQSGKGILVLLPFEAKIPTLFNTCGTMNEDKELKNWLDDDSSLDPENIPATETSLLQECQHDLESTLAKIRSGHAVLTPSAEAACKSFLAHYSSTLETTKVVNHAETLAHALGLAELPPMETTVASRIGLKKKHAPTKNTN